jgi:citrate synthase
MTQLGIGVAALNHDSVFQAAYEKGMKKSEYWTHTLEDCINLIAKLPALAARIYKNMYHPENQLPAINKDLDLVGESTVRRCVLSGILIGFVRKLFCNAWLWRQ